MNGNCHNLFSLTVGAMLAINIDKISSVLPNIENTTNAAMLFVIGGAVGGVLPDMDCSTSYIAKMTKPFSTVICKIERFFDKSVKDHRGILHDPAFQIACLVLSYFFSPALVGVFVGCLTHIFLDMYNPLGVPLLFGVKQLHLGHIYANSKQATKFTALCIAVTLVLGYAIRYLGNYIFNF